MNPKLRAYFLEYDETHRHPMNRLTHKIAIPAIVFHIVAMAGWVPLGPVGGIDLTLAHGIIATSTAFYLPLSLLYAAIMLVASSAALVLSQQLEATLGVSAARGLVVGIAAVGWVVQLAGHAVWEKKAPAFTRNLLQSLVGPVYFLAVLFGHWQVPAWTPPEAAPVAE